jgi:hypothetical protein
VVDGDDFWGIGCGGEFDWGDYVVWGAMEGLKLFLRFSICPYYIISPAHSLSKNIFKGITETSPIFYFTNNILPALTDF